MVNCCVPFCKSESGKKNAVSVSFHDFPLANETLSLQWVSKISRKDWTPSDTSKVCSLHFLSTDYKCGGKLKRLLPNAVPSVFPADSGCTKIKVNVKKIPKTTEKPVLEVKAEILNTLEVDVGSTTKVIKDEQEVKEPEETDDVKNGTLNVKNVDTKVIILKVKPVESQRYSVLGLEMDVETRLGMEHVRETNAYKAKLRRRDEKIAKLENEVSALKKKLDVSHLDEKFLTDLEKVCKFADEGDLRASFILQQIKSFSHKAAHWDERILKELVIWRLVSTKGYEKAKNSFLVLPHRTTLSAYIRAARDVEFEYLDKEKFIKSLINFETGEHASNAFCSALTENSDQDDLQRLTASTLGDLSESNLENIARAAFGNMNGEITPENIAEDSVFQNTFKDSFEVVTRAHFGNITGASLEEMSETTFDKMLENKLGNSHKLGAILENTDDTLESISVNTFDKLLENKLGDKLGSSFESSLEDSLENILKTTPDNSLESDFENMLNGHQDVFSDEISPTCKKMKLY